jgi:leader peptidase (prepilin peptidase)/N-methyltransferase
VNVALAAVSLAPGLALGSFLNVLASRLPLGRSPVAPRSACMSCSRELEWYENVPLVSYVALRGRCRTCRAPIGLRYPLVEATTALLVAACLLVFGATADAAIGALFCIALVTVTATDLEHRIIPNLVVVPTGLLVLAAQTALHPSLEWLIAACAASLFLLLAALAKPGGMGLGDVKLAFLLGAALGRSVGVALMVGMLAALLPSAALFARHGLGARKMFIPFGPFLAFGGVVALFAGERLLDAYLELF